jgi:hypothetical protein
MLGVRSFFTDVSRGLISAFPAGRTFFPELSGYITRKTRWPLRPTSSLQHLNRNIPTMTSNLRRRTRKPVSCEACRRHKLRCDRQNPCGSCRRRSCESSCAYVQKATSTQRALPSPDESRHSDLGVENLVPASGLGIDESLDNACPATRSNHDYTSSQWDALLQRIRRANQQQMALFRSSAHSSHFILAPPGLWTSC